MATIEDKIRMFRKEVNTGKLTSEQLAVYNIFTKSKGHPAHLSVLDSQNRVVPLVVPVGRYSEGCGHILLKHYNEPVGRVTASEILNMLKVIKQGRRTDDGHGHYDYRLKRKAGGVEYTLGVKITKKGDILKSFYSDRRK